MDNSVFRGWRLHRQARSSVLFTRSAVCTDSRTQQSLTKEAQRDSRDCVIPRERVYTLRLSKFLHSFSGERVTHIRDIAAAAATITAANSETTGRRSRTERAHGLERAPFRGACDKSVDRGWDYLKSNGMSGIPDRFVTPHKRRGEIRIAMIMKENEERLTESKMRLYIFQSFDSISIVNCFLLLPHCCEQTFF